MKYLLDVNVLLALAFEEHEFNAPVSRWLVALPRRPRAEFASCSITELGFLRIASTVPLFQADLKRAIEALTRLKSEWRITFLSDDRDTSHLPKWAKTGKQTADAHLCQLAKAHGVVLATLDRKIPGAFLIPEIKAA